MTTRASAWRCDAEIRGFASFGQASAQAGGLLAHCCQGPRNSRPPQGRLARCRTQCTPIGNSLVNPAPGQQGSCQRFQVSQCLGPLRLAAMTNTVPTPRTARACLSAPPQAWNHTISKSLLEAAAPFGVAIQRYGGHTRCSQRSH